jgi:hypothetical protein
MRREDAGGATRAAVQQERGRVQCLCPVRRGKCAVNQQSSQAVVQSANHTFGFAILL